MDYRRIRDRWKGLADWEKNLEVAKCCGELEPETLEALASGEQNPVMIDVPDYVWDLNAMHDIETKLDFDSCSKYQDYLEMATGGGMYDCNEPCMFLATAEQRAQAYVFAMECLKEEEEARNAERAG